MSSLVGNLMFWGGLLLMIIGAILLVIGLINRNAREDKSQKHINFLLIGGILFVIGLIIMIIGVVLKKRAK